MNEGVPRPPARLSPSGSCKGSDGRCLPFGSEGLGPGAVLEGLRGPLPGPGADGGGGGASLSPSGPGTTDQAPGAARTGTAARGTAGGCAGGSAGSRGGGAPPGPGGALARSCRRDVRGISAAYGRRLLR